MLPVGNTFLYVDPIYIQATEARMPQLKKIVLAVGNRLIYADTYDQALAQLSQRRAAAGSSRPRRQPRQRRQRGARRPPAADPRLARIREHLRRYRELAAQGKWAEAGKELEAIEAEVGK